MQGRQIMIGLGVLAVLVGVTVMVWPDSGEEEAPREELEVLGEEFVELKCQRGTSTTEATEAEKRTMEIIERLNEIVESKETSEERKATQVRVFDIIETDCSQLEAS